MKTCGSITASGSEQLNKKKKKLIEIKKFLVLSKLFDIKDLTENRNIYVWTLQIPKNFFTNVLPHLSEKNISVCHGNSLSTCDFSLNLILFFLGNAGIVPNLKGRSEWCISRQRHWGLVIPVFYNKKTGTQHIQHTHSHNIMYGTQRRSEHRLDDLFLAGRSFDHKIHNRVLKVWYMVGNCEKYVKRHTRVIYEVIYARNDVAILDSNFRTKSQNPRLLMTL